MCFLVAIPCYTSPWMRHHTWSCRWYHCVKYVTVKECATALLSFIIFFLVYQSYITVQGIEYILLFFQVNLRQTAMVGLICLLVILITTSSSRQCSKPVRSIKGSYLTGHVIWSKSTGGLGDCLHECTADSQCKSINFRFEDLLCELNDADRYTHPWDYRSKEGHAYSDYPYKVN